MADPKPADPLPSLGPASLSLDEVLIQRERMAQGKYPDLKLLDKVVLKNGPKAYKVALHWVLVNRNTGELHHHSVRIETYRKRVGPGWQVDPARSITLSDDGGDEIAPLMMFLHAIRSGVLPDEAGRYVVLNADDKRLVSRLHVDAFQQMLDARPELAPSVAGRFLDWLSSVGNADEALNKLEDLKVESIQQLSSLVGISALRHALGIWEANRENATEEFWQHTLSEHSLLFSQVFSFPVVIVQGKAYVGGKSIANRSGNLVDFLVKNALTENVALIELKTPMTRLVGKEYRGDVFNVSDDLTGAVLQASNYKSSLLKNYTALMHPDGGPDPQFSAFDPRCLVVVGTLSRDCDAPACRKSFELFRAALRDVQIITFDELFGKVRILLDVLEGRSGGGGYAHAAAVPGQPV